MYKNKRKKKCIVLTESKERITIDLKEFLHETFKTERKQEPKTVYTYQSINRDDKSLDLIEKKRAMEKWKNSLNYYCLRPENLKFEFRDL